ncbi:hypothetical protein BGW80DRAFT_1311621 [Lactifluus volemus]|nr:hypothetical protein BGW80DRAFT_1311621 [Lactifluus volemus]
MHGHDVRAKILPLCHLWALMRSPGSAEDTPGTVRNVAISDDHLRPATTVKHETFATSFIRGTHSTSDESQIPHWCLSRTPRVRQDILLKGHRTAFFTRA